MIVVGIVGDVPTVVTAHIPLPGAPENTVALPFPMTIGSDTIVLFVYVAVSAVGVPAQLAPVPCSNKTVEAVVLFNCTMIPQTYTLACADVGAGTSAVVVAVVMLANADCFAALVQGSAGLSIPVELKI